MIINNTSVRGIYLYSSPAAFEKGDFVVEGSCIYVCTANNPTDVANNTVSGILPSTDSSNFKIYPGDKISDTKEYYDLVKGISSEDKYISSKTLNEILESSYFGIGDNGIIEDYLFYDSIDGTVAYSVKGVKKMISLTGNNRILDEILKASDLNNGTLRLSSSLPELDDIFPSDIETLSDDTPSTQSDDEEEPVIMATSAPVRYRSRIPGVTTLEDTENEILMGAAIVQPSTDPVIGDGTQSAGDTKWTCTCGQRNSSTSYVCSNCGRARPIDEPTTDDGPVDPDPVDQMYWLCAGCGNRISMKYAVCPTCGTPNDNQVITQTLTVVVFDSDGNAISGATVTDNTTGISDTTNASGKTEILIVEFGDTITVTADGYLNFISTAENNYGTLKNPVYCVVLTRAVVTVINVKVINPSGTILSPSAVTVTTPSGVITERIVLRTFSKTGITTISWAGEGYGKSGQSILVSLSYTVADYVNYVQTGNVTIGDTNDFGSITMQPVTAASYIIGGIICDSETNTKLSGVRVEVVVKEDPDTVLGSTTTDSDGAYKLTITSGYNLTLTASKSGYKSETINRASLTQDYAWAPLLVPKVFTVSGTITDSKTSSGISGAAVRCIYSTDTIFSTTTDSHGVYEIKLDRRVIPAGSVISASKTGFGTEVYNPEASDISSDIVRDFILKRNTRAFIGIVTDSDTGNTIAEATVKISNGKISWSSKTDKNGKYGIEITDLTSVSLTFSASADGYVTSSKNETVSSDGGDQIDLALIKEKFIITGKVLDGNNTPIVGAWVAIYVASVLLDKGKTDSNGEFYIALDDTPPLGFTIEASANGYDTERHVVSGVISSPATFEFNLMATEINNMISGQVVNKKGDPISGAKIDVYNTSGSIAALKPEWNTTTDSNGEYSIVIDKDNVVQVMASANDYISSPTITVDFNKYSGVPQEGVDFVLTADYRALNGYITDGLTGVAVVGAVIKIRIASSSELVGSTTSGNRGYYNVSISDRSTTALSISVSADGYITYSSTINLATLGEASRNISLEPEIISSGYTAKVIDSKSLEGLPAAIVKHNSGVYTTDNSGMFTLPAESTFVNQALAVTKSGYDSTTYVITDVDNIVIPMTKTVITYQLGGQITDVLGGPLSEVTVTAYKGITTAVRGTKTTDSNGSFSGLEVLEGDTISLSKSRYRYYSGLTFDKTKPNQFNKSMVGTYFECIIKNEDGDLIPEADVIVTRTPSAKEYMYLADEYGQFNLTNVAAGDTLTIIKSPNYIAATHVITADEIVSVPNGLIPVVEIILTKVEPITFKIVDSWSEDDITSLVIDQVSCSIGVDLSYDSSNKTWTVITNNLQSEISVGETVYYMGRFTIVQEIIDDGYFLKLERKNFTFMVSDKYLKTSLSGIGFTLHSTSGGTTSLTADSNGILTTRAYANDYISLNSDQGYTSSGINNRVITFTSQMTPATQGSIELTKSSVTIVVKDSKIGDALTGVKVTTDTGISKTTSGTGEVDIPGYYPITASLSGYTNSGISSGTEINLHKITAKGTVKDNNEKVVSGATITSSRKDKNNNYITATSGDNGVFFIPVYGDGTTNDILTISKTGYNDATYTVTNGDDTDFTITLHIKNKVKVIDSETKAGIPGANVAIYDSSDNIFISGHVTDSNGEFSTILEGGYKINAGKSGYITNTVTALNGTDDVEIELTKRNYNNWCVYDGFRGESYPLSGVEITSGNGKFTGSKVTDSDGNFSIEGIDLAVGDILILEANNARFNSRNYTITLSNINQGGASIPMTGTTYTVNVSDSYTNEKLDKVTIVNTTYSGYSTTILNGSGAVAFIVGDELVASKAGYNNATCTVSKLGAQNIQLTRIKYKVLAKSASRSDFIPGASITIMNENENIPVRNYTTGTTDGCAYNVIIYPGDTITVSAVGYAEESIVIGETLPDCDRTYEISLTKSKYIIHGTIKDSVLNIPINGVSVSASLVSGATNSISGAIGFEDGEFSLAIPYPETENVIIYATPTGSSSHYQATSKVVAVSGTGTEVSFELIPKYIQGCIKNNKGDVFTSSDLSLIQSVDVGGDTTNLVVTTIKESDPYTYRAYYYPGSELTISIAPGSAFWYYNSETVNVRELSANGDGDTTTVPGQNDIYLSTSKIYFDIADTTNPSYTISNATFDISGIRWESDIKLYSMGDYSPSGDITVSALHYTSVTKSFRSLTMTDLGGGHNGYRINLTRSMSPGRVIDSSGISLIGASVSNKSRGTTATTNNSGNFSLIMYPGDHIQTSLSGYQAKSEILSEVPAGGVTIILEEAISTSVVVSGTVISSTTKAPLSDVTVSAHNYDARSTTGANGQFTLTLPTNGSWEFEFEKSSYATNTLTKIIPASGIENWEVELSPGSTNPQQYVTVAGNVYGRTSGNSDIPLRNAEVTMICIDVEEGEEPETFNTVTNTLGAFAFGNVPANKYYTITLTSAGYSDYTETYYIGNSSKTLYFYMYTQTSSRGDIIPAGRGDTFILRQYTYVDATRRGVGHRYRVQELIDPKYGSIYYRYARSSESITDDVENYSYDIVSTWRSAFESDASILDKFTALQNHYIRKSNELSEVKQQLQGKYCYSELDLSKISNASEKVTNIVISKDNTHYPFNTLLNSSFQVTLFVRKILETTTGTKVYKSYNLTIDLFDCINTLEPEIYKIGDINVRAVAPDNTKVEISIMSGEAEIKGVYYYSPYKLN